MSTTIYDLNCNIDQQNGHFMILSRDGQFGLHSNDLASIQVNMLKSNSIEKLLPLQVEEIDFNVKLYYNLSSKRILSQVLREKKLTISEYYNFLYQVVSAIEDSKEYMLNEQNYIIHEDFIFIGNDFGDVYLTYLPLNQVSNKPQLKDELRDLLIKLVGQIQELQGDGVQQLMNYINHPEFKLAELKKKLNTLRKNSGATAQVSAPVSQQKPQAQAAPAQPVQQPVSSAPEKTEVVQPAAANEESSPPAKPRKKHPVKRGSARSKAAAESPKAKEKPKAKAKVSKQEVEETEVKETKPPNKIVIFALSILAIAGTWKMYEVMPSEGMLYICVGLSVLVVAIAYFFMKVRPQKANKVVTTTVKDEKKPAKKAVNPKVRAKKQQNKPQPAATSKSKEVTPNAVDQNGGSHQYNEKSQQQSAAAVDSDAYFKNLGNETTLLSDPDPQSDATVLLVDEEPKAVPMPFFEVQRNGNVETVRIYQTPFVIGRTAEGTQYVEDSIGISRLHLEVLKVGDNYAIKDLGSKNGTKLNQQPIAANTVQHVKDSDIIKIGKVEYTFKLG
ncbi:DUF6382 domain-containing protein [Halalkalibacter alkaliphilus]|uniref:FHA domain-containing protein n=1 Tax=Halalkalibacter alkaliphilus TaxID=2917993 RepID=A0A9X2CTL7_9BACI|nr:DUF6382 domain-containing protein [Halalkalibacter alkaliphilus]MCL7748018.1 FHA domain-containing protein [Halalkalibacter alkaliphilus]